MAPAMVATGGGGGPGLFTNSNPLDRKIVPDDPGEREVFKVVYVVLESQYQASLSAACKRINAGQPDVAVECSGYILEELRDEANFAQFKKDVEEANIFIGSLIFVQELAEKVTDVVKPLRDQLDAVLVFPSMPEVMRLNKVGGFTMASLGQSKSVVSEFMKKKKADDGSSFEEAMLKLLRTLPKVLKYLPGLLSVSFMRRWRTHASTASRRACARARTRRDLSRRRETRDARRTPSRGPDAARGASRRVDAVAAHTRTTPSTPRRPQKAHKIPTQATRPRTPRAS